MELDRRLFLFAVPALYAAPPVTPSAFTADADRLEIDLRRFMAGYEERPLAQSVTQIGGLWRHAARMMDARPSFAQRKRLASITAKISTMRADALYNAGSPTQARRLTDAAHRLAVAADDHDTAGTARRVRSSLETFEGRAAEALTYARDGQRHARTGPVAASLAAQEARAAALIPTRRPDVVRRAAERATSLAFDLPPNQRGVPGVYFDTYHPVEAAYHATIAHAQAGETTSAHTYADLALPALGSLHLPGYRAVALVNLAVAAARAGRLELDRACTLTDEALEAADGLSRFTPLEGGLNRFRIAVGPHITVPEVRATLARIRDWERDTI